MNNQKMKYLYSGLFDEFGAAIKELPNYWRFPFLFNKQGKALTGKPLLIHHEPQSGLYFYLGLEPTTDADYYEPVCRTVLLPQAERGKLMDQHYKVNVKHWYCIHEKTSKNLFHPNFFKNHDLFETQEIKPEKKVEIYRAILEQLPEQVRNNFDLKDSGSKIFEEFKKFRPDPNDFRDHNITVNYLEPYLNSDKQQKSKLCLTYDVFAEEPEVLNEAKDWPEDIVKKKFDRIEAGWTKTLNEIHERARIYYAKKTAQEISELEREKAANLGFSWKKQGEAR